MIEITQVNASLDEAGDENACLIVGKRVAKRVLRCKDSEIKSIELHRKSIDARKKRDVHFILSFRVELTSPHLEREVVDSVSERDRSRVRAIEDDEPSFPSPISDASKERPVVVGAGCAGLFAALTLAEAGLKPLLIERGDPAFRRSQAIDLFLKERILDPESNIQFGLGGAGTFSDGKLNTGTKNPAHRLILETFVEAGAPRDILWDAKPHIGSDILPTVVTAISQRIEQLGGVVRYRTKLVDIRIDASGAITGIDVQSSQDAAYEPIETKHLILACGHSARDIFELLKDHNVALAQKTFAMGVRIEHPQRDIDRAQYGALAGHPALGAAPYKLVAHLPNGRSVFSFCMCPGGQVVAASSEQGHLCVNGASLNARDGRNANAALLVNVTPEDLPNDDPLAGIELQRACEAAAYRLGGSNWNAPAQLVGDFLAGRDSPDRCHLSSLLFECALAGFHAEHTGLFKIGRTRKMGRAPLHQVQLNGSYLTADAVTHQLLEHLGGACDVAVAELILCITLHLLGHVATLAVVNALADCNQNAVLLFQFFLHIF